MASIDAYQVQDMRCLKRKPRESEALELIRTACRQVNPQKRKKLSLALDDVDVMFPPHASSHPGLHACGENATVLHLSASHCICMHQQQPQPPCRFSLSCGSVSGASLLCLSSSQTTQICWA
jgi:hypothetical protein